MSLCKMCLAWPTSICSLGHCQSIYLNSSFTLQLVDDMCKCTLPQKFSTATILKLVSRGMETPWNNMVLLKIYFMFSTTVSWLKIHAFVCRYFRMCDKHDNVCSDWSFYSTNKNKSPVKPKLR